MTEEKNKPLGTQASTDSSRKTLAGISIDWLISALTNKKKGEPKTASDVSTAKENVNKIMDKLRKL